MAVDLISKRYLVIDDFSDMRSMLRSMLLTYGVTNVDMADCGKDAITQLSKNKYDVVLCDYNLGEGKDGQQVLEEARHHSYIDYATAFLMLTAENTSEMVMGAVEFQPDDYLSKPFNKDMLRSRLEKIIERKTRLVEVVKLLKKGNYQAALDMCDQKIRDNPRNTTELLKLKGDILMQSGRYTEAGELYESIVAKRDVPWALLGLGKVHYHKQQYPEAKTIFQKIIASNDRYMEAYDWLARTLVTLGANKEALNILGSAVEISPKSITRQMELGELACNENELGLAVKAFKKVVNIGAHSIYQTPANYTRLARIQGMNSGKEALATLSKLRSDYGRDNTACLHAAIAESVILNKLGRAQDAKKPFAEANKLFNTLSGNVSKDLTMEMAQACIESGEQEQGLDILRTLVRNNHEDEQVVRKVQEILGAASLGEAGQDMIRATIREVVELNNKGTGLAREGKIDDAIQLLEQALQNMPDNSTINLNLVNVLMMHMKVHGKNDQFVYRIRQTLEHVRKIDPQNPKLEKSRAAFEAMLAAKGGN